RSEKVRVNLSGMCCAMTMAELVVPGIRDKMSIKALGPPVDEAIAMTRRGGQRLVFPLGRLTTVDMDSMALLAAVSAECFMLRASNTLLTSWSRMLSGSVS